MTRSIMATMMLLGCAAAAPLPRGPVVTRVGREVQICFDRAAAQAGQTIQLHRRVCAYVPPKNLTRRCSDAPVETAQVLRVVDERCVVVLAGDASAVRPGDEVELAAP